MNNYDNSFGTYSATNYQESPQYPPGTTPRSQSQRSRFGFHVPSPFPRPRSSAAKPNPSSSFNSINEEPISDDYYSSPDNFPMGFQDHTQNNSFKSNYSQKRLSNSASPNYSQNRLMGSANSSYLQNRSTGSANSSYSQNRSMGSANSSYSQNRSMGSASKNNQNRSQDMFPNSSFNENFPKNLSFTKKSNFSPNQSQNSFGSGKNFRQNQFRSSFNSEGDSSFNASDSYPNTPFQEYGSNQSYSSPLMNPKWKSHNLGQDTADSSYASYTTCSDSSFTDPNLHYNPPYQDTPSPFFTGAMKPAFQGNTYGGLGSSPQFVNPVMEQVVPMNNQQNQYQRNFKRNMKRKAPSEQLSTVRCEICSIEFTSQVPLDMHLQGAKHARKLKSIEILKLLRSQGHAGPNDTDTTIFRCEPCNATLNGVLQLHTHFEGNRHKQKTNPKPEGEDATENGKAESAPVAPVVTPKKKVANASDSDAPPAKVQMLSCDVCGIIVNSSVQLEQHLQSKKHKAKVEGTPLPVKKYRKKKGKSEDGTAAEGGVSEMTVIPDISSSFIKGETIINN